MNRKYFAVWITVLVIENASLMAGASVVDRPNFTGTNSHYVSNRSPLESSRLVALPVGPLELRGWLREFLRRQHDGLTGHIGEISIWIQNNA
jgi:hypothetical protein